VCTCKPHFPLLYHFKWNSIAADLYDYQLQLMYTVWQKRFSENGIDEIYQRYMRRIERMLLQRLLIVFIVNGIVTQILFNNVGNLRGVRPINCFTYTLFRLFSYI
jgi:hypothetical protein